MKATRYKLLAAYLVTYVCISLLQYAHPPNVNQYPYVYLWAFGAFLFPFCLSLSRCRTHFLSDFFALLLVSVVAQAFACTVYLLRTNGFQHRDYETAYWFGFYSIGPIVCAAVWYPIGFVVGYLFTRKASSRMER